MMNLIIAITVTNVVAFTGMFTIVYKIAKHMDKKSCE